MRNGNGCFQRILQAKSKVLILPMRNGNWNSDQIGERGEGVLILPMRNGNIARLMSSIEKSFIRSYPTYEEWKQEFNTDVPWSKGKFLSYLWGMETLLQILLCHHSILLVLILPMRNGNINGEEIDRFGDKVLILPMRNGN